MAITDYYLLSYIQSSGTQWINTGVTPTSNYKVKTKFNLLATGSHQYWTDIFGANNGDDSVGAFNLRYGNGGTSGNSFWFYNKYIGQVKPKTMPYITINQIAEIEMSSSGIVFNGTSYGYNGSSLSGTTRNTMGIFKNNSFSFSSGSLRLYYFQIYNGSTSVRNFVPAKRISDNVIGLYDRTNNAFYTNNGSGTFTAGSTTSYTLTLNASTGGSVSGGGTKTVNPDGSYRYTAIATASSGYSFDGWYSNSSYTTKVSSSSSYSSTSNANLTLYAKFVQLYTKVYFNNNNSWKLGYAYIKISGVWKRVKDVYIKNNGSWLKNKA